ncbi:PREDICTED: uncharacterized protein LOC105364444 [Ceratosolen solmsi marchali]|uniref:Uncharacterized protein LOC105364444 n=1 Tax=Ceratosolen solmsi marchali TaxID=326594 RepID=A0AAJ6YM72_9HYME|nr:PREDICTED: uncharacterized protein LOC105364444 [Ceratosolen solmsi marchali]
MFLLLRLFNSIFFLIINIAIALYTFHRFFRAMRFHYQLIDEVEEFSYLVDQSRASLEYIGNNITEAIKEMQSDIGKEIYVTHNLTILITKINATSKRFNDLEEEIIEFARLNENLDNAVVETPLNINEEVRRILRRKYLVNEQDQQQLTQECPRSPRKPLKVQSGLGLMESVQSQPNPIQKLPSYHQTRPYNHQKPRSPNLVPDVMLFDEQRTIGTIDKPIGFRPPWMCQV